MTSDENAPDDVSRLLRVAGPRPAIPEELAGGVYGAVHAQWRTHLRRRRVRRLSIVMGGLAGLGLTTLLGPGVARRLGHALAPPAVAFVERSKGGGVWASATKSARSFLPERAPALAGSWLETAADGRAALRLDGRTSLRLDAGTRVRILSSSAVWLERGALYVDNPEGAENTPLEVHTAHGVARDLGTQFEVRADPGGMRIRVREGLVVLASHGVEHQVGAGSELTVSEAGVERNDIAPYDPAWRWVEQAAPGFELEGQSLGAFLKWFERETGLSARLTPEASARISAEATLHGSIEGLTPSEALDLVLPTCGLRPRWQDGIVWIEPVSGVSESVAHEGSMQ